MKNNPRVYLLLTILVGLVVLQPFFDFQYYLSQGDHGRDLYCSWRAMEGDVPYRDFSWPFGPLMAYYYALFLKLFGVSVQSVLLGQNLLILLSGISIYLICLNFFSPPLSLCGALWYWAFRKAAFFYTYNHSGGILFLLLSVLALMNYIRNPRRVFAYWGSAALLCLLHIRLNIGVSTLVGFFAGLLIVDQVLNVAEKQTNRKVFLGLAAGLLAVTAAVHLALLYPLPKYIWGQCFPYARSQRTDVSLDVLKTAGFLKDYVTGVFNGSWPRRIAGLLTCLSPLYLPWMIARSPLAGEEKKKLLLAFSALFGLLLLSLHEFLLSGVHYRLNWGVPLFILIIFFTAGIVFKTAPPAVNTPTIRGLIITVFVFSAFFSVRNDHAVIRIYKNADNRLNIPPNNVYTSQNPYWFMAVDGTYHYLSHSLGKNEQFFALPFDPLFYFLTQTKSPTRQLIFFEHKNIPPQQERQTIADLEAHHVDTIVVSNRSHAPHEGLGTLGVEYCPLIANYILENYDPVVYIGDWVNPAGWAWQYGVKIYKRKPDRPVSSLK